MSIIMRYDRLFLVAAAVSCCCQALVAQTSTQSAREVFEILDTNSDGVLSPQEFRQTSFATFNELDANKDGYLTFEETFEEEYQHERTQAALTQPQPTITRPTTTEGVAAFFVLFHFSYIAFAYLLPAMWNLGLVAEPQADNMAIRCKLISSWLPVLIIVTGVPAFGLFPSVLLFLLVMVNMKVLQFLELVPLAAVMYALVVPVLAIYLGGGPG